MNHRHKAMSLPSLSLPPARLQSGQVMPFRPCTSYLLPVALCPVCEQNRLNRTRNPTATATGRHTGAEVKGSGIPCGDNRDHAQSSACQAPAVPPRSPY